MQGELPLIHSWHVHLLFVNSDPEEVEGAKKLYFEFLTAFNLTTEDDDHCVDLLHNDHMCTFGIEVGGETGNPFLSGNWAIYFLPKDLAAVVTYMSQHRDDFSVLVHPNSSNHLLDHSEYTIWLGNTWPLNLAPFRHD